MTNLPDREGAGAETGAVRVEDVGSGRSGAGSAGRLLLALLAAALISVSAASLEARTTRPPAPAAAGRVTGALFCPHGGARDWRGWLVISNPGSRSVLARVSSFGPGGPTSVASFRVQPLRQVYRALPALESAGATQVEYFGGTLAAATVVRSSGPRGGVAAARCGTQFPRRWVAPDAATGPGEHGYLVVMNPFAQDAQFDVVIRTERRELTPSELTPVVLDGATSVALPLHRFLLAGRGERTTTVEVHSTIGRVIVGALNVREEGVSAEMAVAGLARTWVFPAPAYALDTTVAIANPGLEESLLSVVLHQPAGRVRGVATEDLLPRGQPRSYRLTGPKGAGAVIAGTAAIAAGRLVAGPKGDEAAIAGAIEPARRWLVLPTLPPGGGSPILLLQNPGEVPAQVSVRLFGESGEVSAGGDSSVEIAPGATLGWRYPRRSERPLSALVTAEGGAVVAAGASVSLGGEGYAMTLGFPLHEEGGIQD